MIHFMGLNEEPFQLMKQGDKLYEVRLNDAKRKKLRKDDRIEFTRLPDKQETLLVDVLNILPYDSFNQLYKDLPLEDFAKDNDSHQHLVETMYNTYTKEQEEQCGVLAIQIGLSKGPYPLKTIQGK